MGRRGGSDDDEDYQDEEELKQQQKLKRKSRLQQEKSKYQDGYDDDCIGDAKDQKYLDDLTEIEREEEIYKRKENRKRYIEEQKIRKDHEKQQKNKRIQQELDKEARYKRGNKDYSESSNGSRSSSKDSQKSKNYDDDNDKNKKSNMKEDDELKGQLQRITLTRDQLENLYQKSNFAELVKGCYVRARSDMKQQDSSSPYIFSKILRVEQGQKTYNLSNGSTNYIIILMHQKREKSFLIKYVSNQEITESEFTYFSIYNPIPKQEEIENTLRVFNKNKTTATVDDQQLRKNQLMKIKDMLFKNQDFKMTRLQINESIEIMDNKLRLIQVDLDQLIEANKMDELDKKQKYQKQYQYWLDLLYKKRAQTSDKKAFQKHKFFENDMLGDQSKQKSRSKEEARLKKISQLNSDYMQEIEMNKKFLNFEKSETLKENFHKIHNIALPQIDSIVDSWEQQLDSKQIILGILQPIK